MAKKRGRKRKNDLYFGPEQEEAVVKFLESEDIRERNAIYNQWLRDPLNKMVESIIRRYKLYRKGISFEDLHCDTLSFLITKADKFEHSKGKKAYSYYGTICKNYLLGLLIGDEKNIKRSNSYDDYVTELETKEEYQYELEEPDFSVNGFINKLISEIKDEMSGKTQVGKKKISENEYKVGLALIEILQNWDTTLDLMSGGNKFNKNTVLESMRNYTNLNTKDIRIAMKRYKTLYNLIKIKGLEDGF